jgi:serine/threonine protein kinase
MVEIINNIAKIGNHYLMYLNQKLDHGAFGEIYLGLNQKTLQEVAVKLEIKSSKHPQLHHETRILKDLQNGIGIPKIYYYHEIENYSCLVMELLGKNLENLFTNLGRKFSLKTTLLLGKQMYNRIEYMHKKGIIHRDIKPNNFLMGRNDKNNILYIIDMGLSKRYIDQNKKHIPYKEGKNLTGTVRYASIFTHLGFEQSRRDDLEGISYVLIYFLKGSLPWMGMKGKNKKEKYDKIMEKKIGTSLDKLCEDLPNEFIDILNYPRKLKFEDEPDYIYVNELINKIMKRYDYEMDYKYDWIVFGNNNEGNNLNNIFKEDNIDDLKENENKNSSENNVQNGNLNNSQVVNSNVNDLLKPDLFLNKTTNENFHNNIFKKYK